MKLIQSINNTFCFELVLGTHFDKSYSENQIGARNRSCDHLKQTKRLLVTNRESPETLCRTTLETTLVLETNFKIYLE